MGVSPWQDFPEEFPSPFKSLTYELAVLRSKRESVVNVAIEHMRRLQRTYQVKTTEKARAFMEKIPILNAIIVDSRRGEGISHKKEFLGILLHK